MFSRIRSAFRRPAAVLQSPNRAEIIAARTLAGYARESAARNESPYYTVNRYAR